MTNKLFHFLTARSNSSAVEIKANEEVPITPTQVLPPLSPPPLPIRMHPMSKKFDEMPKMSSMDNIHIPLQMIPTSIMPKQMIPMSRPSTIPSSLISAPIVPTPAAPNVPRPMLFSKRIGIIPKQESRMEEEVTEVSETTTFPATNIPVKESEPTTTKKTKSETVVEIFSTTGLINSAEVLTSTPEPSTVPSNDLRMNKEAENVMGEVSVSAGTTENKELPETTTTFSSTTTEEPVPRPVFIIEDVKPQVKLVPAPTGEFLYESDFAKYLNQFYYSKPTVFDNLQMSKRHTPIFETMKI